MRYAIVGVLMAVLTPAMAEAGGRHHGGHGGYGGGHHGHRDRGGDRWSVSIGFGSSDYYGSSSSIGFNYSRGYDRGWSRPSTFDCRPPVVYRPAPTPVYVPPPVVYQPAPVYCPPPVVYSPPVYYYQPSPVYSYSQTSYYYGR